MIIRRVEDILAAAEESGARWRISVAAPHDRAVLRAVAEAVSRGFAEATLFGRNAEIQAAADAEGIVIGPGMTVVSILSDKDIIRAATESVQTGEAQVLVKGLVPTGSLFRAVLNRQFGLKSAGILSHVAVFNDPLAGRLMLLTDAGINIAPNVHRKAQIVANAVAVAHRLGIERPRVALLAAIDTVQYPYMQATLDATLVSRIARATMPDAVVEGPFALDNAVSLKAAEKKDRKGEVAGCADILCAPEIETANVLYKSLQTFCGLTLASAVVGARSPIAVPSRTDSAQTKLMSIALACLLSK